MELGAVGVWTAALDVLPAAQAREAAAELEELGYGAIWIPEAVGREAMTNAAMLLDATRTVVVATGIASIWLRSATAAAAAQHTLSEAHPGRFLLGLGVSHRPMVEGVLGQSYHRPFSAMSAYLDAMDGALVLAPAPEVPPARVLAALGPRMLRLSAERAAGAHPYLGTPEHTRQAREILGAGPLLLPEQGVILERDPSRAREIARANLGIYIGLANYANNWRRLGFEEEDLLSGGSDRLIDAIFAWGDLAAILERLREHLDAGADHVAVQVLRPSLAEVPREEWRELAPAVASLRPGPV